MAWITIDEEGLMAVRCDYEQRGVVKEIGGRWDSIASVWQVAFTISNLQYLLDNLDCPNISEEVERKVQGQADKEKRLRQLRCLSKHDVPVNLRVPGFKMALRNYQKLGVQFCLTNGEGALVADEMGLGKTAQAIATSLFLKSKGLAKKVLVVTPAGLKFNWPIEIEKFTDEKYVVINGTPDERMAQWLRDDAFFYIVNFELVTEDLFGGREKKKKEKETPEEKAKRLEYEAKMSRRMRLLGPARTRRWDMIVVDEVHALKHHGSKRTQNVKRMHGRFRMGLTGTPLDGRLEELHSVMGFVYPGLLESKTRFMQKHAVCDPFGKVIRYRKIGEVRSRIEPFFIRRLKSQVLKELPDKIYQNIMVQLSKEEREIYQALATNGHKATEDVQAMVAVIRCKQFCDHPSLIEEKCGSSKLEALREVLQEVIVDNGHKVLIFSQYAQMTARLLRELDAMGLKYLYLWGETPKRERIDMQRQFNEDKSIDLMIGTEAMSQGLNFTAADYVVNYDDNWAPAYMRQREDRAHRIGQRNVVTVVNFICQDTIEERIRDVLLAKEKVSALVLGDDTDVAILKRLGPQAMAQML